MYLNLVLFCIFIGVFASLLQEGIWNNTLTLINVLLATLIGTNYGEPIASYLASQLPSFTLVWDIMGYWIAFCIALVLLSSATNALSKIKVRFKQPIDLPIGAALGAWIAWVMLSFVIMTLHTAPLDRNFLGGFQETPETRMFFGTAPDRIWLAFAHAQSTGGLQTTNSEGAVNAFDPKGEFVFKYAERRFAIQNRLELLVK